MVTLTEKKKILFRHCMSLSLLVSLDFSKIKYMQKKGWSETHSVITPKLPEKLYPKTKGDFTTITAIKDENLLAIIMATAQHQGNSRQGSRYELLDKLGSGTYGDVYKCVDVFTKQVYVLKKLKAASQTAQLLREISIMRRLSKLHPNIVTLIEVEAVASDSPEIVMEKLPLNLLQFLQSFRDLGFVPMFYIKIIIRDVLRACAFLHSRTIAHRDLKPENVLIDFVDTTTGELVVDPHASPEKVHSILASLHGRLFETQRVVHRLKKKVDRVKLFAKNKREAQAKKAEEEKEKAKLNNDSGTPSSRASPSVSYTSAISIASIAPAAEVKASGMHRPAAQRAETAAPPTTELNEGTEDHVEVGIPMKEISPSGRDEDQSSSSPVNIIKRVSHQRPSDKSTKLSGSGVAESAIQDAAGQNRELSMSIPSLAQSSSPCAASFDTQTPTHDPFASAKPSTTELVSYASPAKLLEVFDSYNLAMTENKSLTNQHQGIVAHLRYLAEMLNYVQMSINFPEVQKTHQNVAGRGLAPGQGLPPLTHREVEHYRTAFRIPPLDNDTRAAHTEQIHRKSRQLEKEKAEIELRIDQQQDLIESLVTESDWLRDPPVSIYESLVRELEAQLTSEEAKLKRMLEPNALPIFPIAKLCDFGMCRMMFPSDQTAAATTELNTGLYRAPSSLSPPATIPRGNPESGGETMILPSAATVSILSSLNKNKLNATSNQNSAAKQQQSCGNASESEVLNLHDGEIQTPSPSMLALAQQEVVNLLLPTPPLPNVSTCAAIPSHIPHSPTNPPRIPTPRVMTISYRAAEVLLDKPLYADSIDLWSVGCLIPELVTLNILVEYVPANRDAPENCAHIDYGDGLVPNILSLFQVLGVPKTREEWAAISEPSMVNVFAKDFPKFKSKLKGWSGGALAAALGDEGMDLLLRMLLFIPEHRITAQQALDHPWLAEVRFVELPQMAINKK